MNNILYSIKNFVFSNFPVLERIFAHNRYSRDSWIKHEASLIPAESKVLDVGAGSCPYRNLFLHCTYMAHDFSKLDHRQLRGQKGYGKLDIISDICSLPIDSESIDVVLCTEVIEHVPTPILAVKEMARIMKPGGTLLLSAPLQSGLHREPYHFYGGFTPYWYQTFLTKEGFSQVEINSVGGLFSTCSTLSLYAAIYLSPSKTRALPFLVRVVFLFLWIAALPFLLLVAPLLFYLLNKALKVEMFAEGYHVKAVKRHSSGCSCEEP